MGSDTPLEALQHTIVWGLGFRVKSLGFRFWYPIRSSLPRGGLGSKRPRWRRDGGERYVPTNGRPWLIYLLLLLLLLWRLEFEV